MINIELRNYIEKKIIPKYQQLDKAHQESHVFDVIETALDIAENYKVNLEMVYVIAAFHDLGLIVDRKTHHIVGGMMLETDSFINDYFNKEEIQTMKEAVEDHRASNNIAPRSIYGMIIAEADRSDSYLEIIKRSFLFHFDDDSYKYDYDKSFNRVLNHLEEKYGYNGYLKVWLETKKVKEMLKAIRDLIADPIKFKEFCLPIYNELLKNYN